MLSATIRVLLEISLLFQVWTHAHWSVALCLTLFALRADLEDWAIER